MTSPTPAAIRAARLEAPKMRDRDLAETLGISEAQLVAAHVGTHHGQTVTAIAAHPDAVMPHLARLGEVMSLTRNRSCVHERVGTFGDYRSGAHAAMVLGRDIDTRIFPKYWTYGFAVERAADADTPEAPPRRSLQFFDETGTALHKVHLRAGSDHAAWPALVTDLATPDQAQVLDVAPPAPVEGALASPEKRETLIAEWARMTDTHQFNRLAARLGMNRLGAYRLAGAPYVRALDPGCMGTFLEAVAQAGQNIVLFVGNRGHIQIHWGPIETVRPMGPWLNVMDARFNLHLRGDHVAEVYVVDKPTKRGPAVSLEAFDAEGALILQVFGERTDTDDLTRWQAILDALPDLGTDAADAVDSVRADRAEASA